MRTIYLIRHGAPAFPGGERVCLSSTDVPLSDEGRAQGAMLRECFSGIALQGVYSSELTRARETASFLSSEVKTVPGLQELGVGDWEGLTFREIRQHFPEEYALRGQDPVRHGIPGGEPPEACRERAMTALYRILEESTGDIAVVAHAGINRLVLCKLLGRELNEFLSIPQPYGCVNILFWDGDTLRADAVGLCPEAK